MPELLGRVVESTLRYNMFTRGDSVGVAVSGGADSVCLLHILSDLAPAWNLSLFVLHLDHGLRGPASDADAAFVAGLAAHLGLPFRSRRVEIAAIADNLEQAAREARLAFYRDVRYDERLRAVATGHTRSDQAETVLFRLLRGSGTAGLSAIRPITETGLIRPLLEIDRAEIEAWLTERSLPWCEDATNRDPTFARNRIRHQLLPELTAAWNPQLPTTLAQMATLAQDDEDYWSAEIDRIYPEIARSGGSAVLLQTELLLLQPPALARRLLRRAIGAVRGNLRGVDFSHVEEILTLCRQPEGHGRLQIPGLDAFRSFEWLRLAPPATTPTERNWEYPLTPPATVTLPAFSLHLELSRPDRENCDYNEKETYLDWDCLAGPLVLRNWRPGDRYQPVDYGGEQKIKSLFQETRVPLWERRDWPVITAGGQIVWARRFGPAQQCAVMPSTASILRIRLSITVQ
ncbi:MAG: tRNA lysidine(34) synthetase TilS [Bryobacteraceae bacterium]